MENRTVMDCYLGYCPLCKNWLIKSEGHLVCPKCGYDKEHFDKINQARADKWMGKEDEVKDRPIIQYNHTGVKCPSCGSPKYFCRGAHVIPNADLTTIREGYLVQCHHCGHQWYYRFL